MNINSQRIEPWPVAIGTFFAVLITALAAWAVVAQRNREELVSADYYEQEIAYQQQFNRLKRSADAGVTFGYVSGGQGGSIRIVWPVVSRPADVTGRVGLYRPSEAALDRELPLAVGVDGVQTIDAGTLKPGLWKVRVQWGPQQSGYYAEGSLVVPSAVAAASAP